MRRLESWIVKLLLAASLALLTACQATDEMTVGNPAELAVKMNGGWLRDKRANKKVIAPTIEEASFLCDIGSCPNAATAMISIVDAAGSSHRLDRDKAIDLMMALPLLSGTGFEDSVVSVIAGPLFGFRGMVPKKFNGNDIYFAQEILAHGNKLVMIMAAVPLGGEDAVTAVLHNLEDGIIVDGKPIRR
jgi:hypothetical protein